MKKILLPLFKLAEQIIIFFKRIVTFHLHLGSSDYYPSNRANKGLFKIFNTNLDRIYFWTNLAKKHNSLKYFYFKKPEKNFESDFKEKKINDLNTKTFKILREFYKNGVVEIPNFFNKYEYKLINFFFEKKINKKINLQDKFSWKSNSKVLNQTIHNKIKIFEKHIFSKNIGSQNYILSAWKKKVNQRSPVKDDINFHSDRFIPAIKFLYFPTKVDVDPFEYCIGSHKIDKKFFENYKIIHKYSNCEISSKKLNYANFKTKKFKVKKNTLVIAATHGLHRRSQSQKNNIYGIRRFITISYYNKFTRYDLLKNMVVFKN